MMIFERNFSLNSILYLLISELQIKLASEPKQVSVWYQKNGSLSVIHDLLFYKIDDRNNDSVHFCLRPNRQPEARVKLIKIFDKATLLILMITIMDFILIIGAGAYTFLFNFSFFYQGCRVNKSRPCK